MLSLLIALALPAHAAELPRHVLLADLGLHVLGVGYQQTLSPELAVQIDLDWYTPWTQNTDLLGLSGAAYTSDLSGAVIRGRVFVYPFGAAPTGLWVSPFAQAGPAWATVAGASKAGVVAAVGASVGYGWLVAERLHIAFGLGGQYHVARITDTAGSPNFGRFYPTLDGSVGYAF